MLVRTSFILDSSPVILDNIREPRLSRAIRVPAKCSVVMPRCTSLVSSPPRFELASVKEGDTNLLISD